MKYWSFLAYFHGILAGAIIEGMVLVLGGAILNDMETVA